MGVLSESSSIGISGGDADNDEGRADTEGANEGRADIEGAKDPPGDELGADAFGSVFIGLFRLTRERGRSARLESFAPCNSSASTEESTATLSARTRVRILAVDAIFCFLVGMCIIVFCCVCETVTERWLVLGFVLFCFVERYGCR